MLRSFGWAQSKPKLSIAPLLVVFAGLFYYCRSMAISGVESTKMWHLYILRCSDDSLYTGITTDIQRRIKTHNNGNGGRYTRSRLPVSLLYTESHPTRSTVLKRELQIKGWSKKRKLSLIYHDMESLKIFSKSTWLPTIH